MGKEKLWWKFTCGESGWATCWTTTLGWDFTGEVAGAGVCTGVVTDGVLVEACTGCAGNVAGCWTVVGGGCTAKYIFVGPSTPCFPVVACAKRGIYLYRTKL